MRTILSYYLAVYGDSDHRSYLLYEVKPIFEELKQTKAFSENLSVQSFIGSREDEAEISSRSA